MSENEMIERKAFALRKKAMNMIANGFNLFIKHGGKVVLDCDRMFLSNSEKVSLTFCGNNKIIITDD